MRALDVATFKRDLVSRQRWLHVPRGMGVVVPAAEHAHLHRALGSADASTPNSKSHQVCVNLFRRATRRQWSLRWVPALCASSDGAKLFVFFYSTLVCPRTWTYEHETQTRNLSPRKSIVWKTSTHAFITFLFDSGSGNIVFALLNTPSSFLILTAYKEWFSSVENCFVFVSGCLSLHSFSFKCHSDRGVDK